MTRVAQVGGSHYEARGLQHWDVIERHDVAYLEAQATRYIVRWDRKGRTQAERVEDLEKAVSYLQRLLQDRPKVRRQVPDDVLMTFFEANSLDPEKRDLINLILSTGGFADLQSATRQLEQMIARERGS